MSNFFLDLFGWLAGNIIKNLFIGAVGIAVGILISYRPYTSIIQFARRSS
ncbi:hypothetical protein SAMN04487866_10176 [Thermoactinomyces sp. DSM 45891]|nr:hypothetical protein [Thermoactinomyces sp. DSM 45891]SFW98758.1 hypothetical protein SAMN04487866_10176 [Thermoactinomyces sp. DSM 45891]